MALALAACAVQPHTPAPQLPSSQLPDYRHDSIQRSGAILPSYTSGLLVRRGQCLVIENVEGVLLPVWPEGTEVTATTVITPNLRGHAPLLIGGRAGVTGRYVHAHDGSLARAAGAEAARCARRGIIVEKANRVYMPESAAEYAAISDAVLIAEIIGIDPSDPLGDRFLTTVTARVVEPITGSFSIGQVIRLRHAAGQDESGTWLVASHDALLAIGGPTAKPGDRLLLFVNRDFYRQAAEGRGGQPIPGYLGASIYRVTDGRIEQHDATLPATVEELKRLIARP